MGYAPLNMLGTIQVTHFVSNIVNLFPTQKLRSFLYKYFQSQKTAELLLDLKVNSILCSPQVAAVDTATVICEVIVVELTIKFSNCVLFYFSFVNYYI